MRSSSKRLGRRWRAGKIAGSVVGAIVIVAAGTVAVHRFLTWRAEAPVTGPLQLSSAVSHSTVYSLGGFEVRWNGQTGGLTVVSSTDRGHIVYATPPGKSFVAAARGVMTSTEKIGYFTLHRHRSTTYNKQTVTGIDRTGNVLVISGRLIASDGKAVSYTFKLQPTATDELHYSLNAGQPANRVYLTWASTPKEAYYGFGVQYTAFNMNGRYLPILVEEHGDGRGVQPLTLLADISNGAGGHWYNTYAPVPHFITNTMQSLYSANTEYQAFNFTRASIGQLAVDAANATGIVYNGSTPAALQQAYTATVGRMQPLPAWTQQGLIFGAEGGTAIVEQRLKQLQNAGVPVSGLWIQDWVGQRTTSFGQQLWWNWQLDTAHYPHWNQFTSYLRQHHIQLLGYINPFLVDTKGQPGMQNLYAVAKARGYFVKDAAGQPYPFRYPGFTAYLIDLTNPHAVQWYEHIMMTQLVDHGFSGWMADFGEELPLDAHLYNGETGAQFHNEYPVAWQKLNDAVLNKAGLSKSALVFYRSGFSTSPSYATDFWLGDQLESWGGSNGLESSVTALLTAGLSGYTLESSDIGGYTSIVRFPLHYVRSPELLERWIEVDAFTSLFRSHEGNLPAHNAQVYSTPALVAQTRRFAVIFKALAPYREQLMRQAATTGSPLDRPVFYNYPNDPTAYTLGSKEFMLGSDVLVAPIYKPGQQSARVYLPQGSWREIWTGRTRHVAKGEDVTVQAPIGQPAVFSRSGTEAAHELAAAVAQVNQKPNHKN